MEMMVISEETICKIVYIMNPVKLKTLNLHREKVTGPMRWLYAMMGGFSLFVKYSVIYFNFSVYEKAATI